MNANEAFSQSVPEAPENQKINLCVPAINTETLNNLELNQEITFRESHRGHQTLREAAVDANSDNEQPNYDLMPSS